MRKVVIDPGICGFITSAEAASEDEGETVTLRVASGCEGVREMAADLSGELDPIGCCVAKGGAGPVYDAARIHCPHAACPVPAGIIKCIEAECGLALPKDASIHFKD